MLEKKQLFLLSPNVQNNKKQQFFNGVQSTQNTNSLVFLSPQHASTTQFPNVNSTKNNNNNNNKQSQKRNSNSNGNMGDAQLQKINNNNNRNIRNQYSQNFPTAPTTISGSGEIIEIKNTSSKLKIESQLILEKQEKFNAVTKRKDSHQDSYLPNIKPLKPPGFNLSLKPSNKERIVKAALQNSLQTQIKEHFITQKEKQQKLKNDYECVFQHIQTRQLIGNNEEVTKKQQPLTMKNSEKDLLQNLGQQPIKNELFKESFQSQLSKFLVDTKSIKVPSLFNLEDVSILSPHNNAKQYNSYKNTNRQATHQQKYQVNSQNLTITKHQNLLQHIQQQGNQSSSFLSPQNSNKFLNQQLQHNLENQSYIRYRSQNLREKGHNTIPQSQQDNKIKAKPQLSIEIVDDDLENSCQIAREQIQQNHSVPKQTQKIIMDYKRLSQSDVQIESSDDKIFNLKQDTEKQNQDSQSQDCEIVQGENKNRKSKILLIHTLNQKQPNQKHSDPNIISSISNYNNDSNFQKTNDNYSQILNVVLDQSYQSKNQSKTKKKQQKVKEQSEQNPAHVAAQRIEMWRNQSILLCQSLKLEHNSTVQNQNVNNKQMTSSTFKRSKLSQQNRIRSIKAKNKKSRPSSFNNTPNKYHEMTRIDPVTEKRYNQLSKRIKFNRRFERSHLPILIIQYDGIIGIFVKTEIATDVQQFVVRQNLVKCIQILKEHFQIIILIKKQSNDKIKLIQDHLSSIELQQNNKKCQKYDGLYQLKSQQISYEQILLDFEVSRERENIYIVEPTLTVDMSKHKQHTHHILNNQINCETDIIRIFVPHIQWYSEYKTYNICLKTIAEFITNQFNLEDGNQINLKETTDLRATRIKSQNLDREKRMQQINSEHQRNPSILRIQQNNSKQRIQSRKQSLESFEESNNDKDKTSYPHMQQSQQNQNMDLTTYHKLLAQNQYISQQITNYQLKYDKMQKLLTNNQQLLLNNNYSNNAFEKQILYISYFDCEQNSNQTSFLKYGLEQFGSIQKGKEECDIFKDLCKKKFKQI